MTTTTITRKTTLPPGSWELDTTHLTRPITRWLGAFLPEAMQRGFASTMRRYGMLLAGFDIAIDDGFVYMCPRPVGAPKEAKGPPPRAVFKVLNAIHPELRRRNRRVAEVFATKAWRDDVRRWDEDLFPQLRRENGALAAVDPDALDDDALLQHVAACTKQLEEALFHHHDFNACIGLPIGDLLVQARAWTGLAHDQLVPLLRGSSPISAGFDRELAHFAKDIDPRDPELVANLRRKASAAAWFAAIDHHTLSGHDLSEATTTETPAALRAVLLGAAAQLQRGETGVTSRDATSAAEAKVRDAVPAAHRSAFDALLAEARLVSRIRDERTFHNDLWTLGLTRRALLAAGRRLAARGALAEAEHVVDMLPSELAPALRSGAGAVTAAEIAKRVHARVSRTTADAPAHVGPPGAPPPHEWLPPAQARASRAISAFVREMFDGAPVGPLAAAAPVDGAPRGIVGLAASPGTYEGRARIVLGPDAFDTIAPGDVLVARTTSPTFNVLLPMLGGIVTDRGGLLSHAAIVAREYGIPAVVGTTDATKRITDGARVRIDGAAGTVQLV